MEQIFGAPRFPLAKPCDVAECSRSIGASWECDALSWLCLVQSQKCNATLVRVLQAGNKYFGFALLQLQQMMLVQELSKAVVRSVRVDVGLVQSAQSRKGADDQNF